MVGVKASFSTLPLLVSSRHDHSTPRPLNLRISPLHTPFASVSPSRRYASFSQNTLPAFRLAMGCCFSEPVDFETEVNLYHFDLHRAVGKGAFGKVRPIWPHELPANSRRSASLSTKSPKGFMPSSTSRKPSVSVRKLSPMLFKSVDYWRRYGVTGQSCSSLTSFL